MATGLLAPVGRAAPPLLPGPPLIGNLLEFGREPLGLIRRAHELLGPVFTFRLGRKPVTALIGPELHRVFFSLPSTVLTTAQVYDDVKATFGDRFSLAAADDAADELRPVLARAFAAEQLV